MGSEISHDEASKSLGVLVDEADDSHIMRLARYIEQQRAVSARLAACEAERDVWKADAQSRVTRLAAREEALRKIAKPDVKMRDTYGIIDRYEHGFYVAEQAAMRIARAALKEPIRG